MRRLSLLILMFALVAACYNKEDYDLTQPGILVLSVDRGSIAADGLSVATLTAQISPEAAPARRTVVFTTTTGTFIGGTGTSATEREVTVDSAGRGTIQLRSSTVIETARVTARVKDLPQTQQQLDVSFTAANPADVIRFASVPQEAPADGATVSTIVVEVPVASSLPTGSRTVTFATTAGKFVPGDTDTASVPLDASGRATAQLKSPAGAADAVVRATVNGITTSTTIRFARALPESVEVVPQGFAVEAELASSMNIDIFLRRTVGTPASGTVVLLTAVGSDGSTVGIFRSARVTADATGRASAVYTAGDTAYRGPVTIRAQVEGTSVGGTAVIQVIEPTN